jgi:hypothetical protein
MPTPKAAAPVQLRCWPCREEVAMAVVEVKYVQLDKEFYPCCHRCARTVQLLWDQRASRIFGVKLDQIAYAQALDIDDQEAWRSLLQDTRLVIVGSDAEKLYNQRLRRGGSR